MQALANMKTVIDSLVWIPKSSLTQQEQVLLMFDKLTLASTDSYSDKQVELFEDFEDHIGVPRYWYFNKYTEKPIDETVFPLIKFPKFFGTLREGQKEGTRKYLDRLSSDAKYGGILQAKCGAGKTVSALYIASKLKTRTLVLVHKTDLMDQWQEAIDTFLPETYIGVVKGKKITFPKAEITVATFQTIKSKFKMLSNVGFFEYFGLVIIDECHHVPADTFAETLKMFSAKVRMGLTATPRRRDGLEQVFEWNIGPVLAVMKGETLTGQYKQTLYQSNINLNKHKLYGGKGRVCISHVITAIANNPLRNHFILEVLQSAVQKGRKVLVLSNRVDQIVYLHEQWKKLVGDSSGLYMGKMSAQQLKLSTQKQVIFGTAKMFAEGTDIPSLDTLCIVSPMSDIEQMIGRIQRLYDGKKVPFVWDLVDNDKISLAMGKKRKEYLEATGFTEQK